MRTILCVAEKPSIAKSVAFYLAPGGKYAHSNTRSKYVKNYTFESDFQGQRCKIIVTALLGHLMNFDFPDRFRGWSSCDPVELFHAQIEKKITQQDVAKNLESQSRYVSDLVIWTDCDREGEAIGNEVSSVCLRVKPNIKVHRARFAVIQKQDIMRTWENLDVMDNRQVEAVDARSELDLRIGAAFTRMQTLTLRNVLEEKTVASYGSCQFPTLYFVVDRYKRVKDFTPEPFWSIDAQIVPRLNAPPSESIKLSWDRNHLFDHRSAFILFENCLEYTDAFVSKVNFTPATKYPPFPLTTVELQKFASSRFGMSGDVTMKIAEKLYQQGYISYPRTETDSFAPNFQLRPLIGAQASNNTWGNYANRLADESSGLFRFPRKGRANDNAHPPIHPTQQIPTNLNPQENKIYEFVVRRFLACCSQPARGNSTQAKINIGIESFSLSGLIITEYNYLEVYPWDKWATGTVPSFIKEGVTLPISSLKLTESKTTAPKYLTEPELITLMEKNGIGTDATIHEHIAKILSRDYAQKSGKFFIPSVLGMSLVEAYENMEMRLSLSRPYLRAKMEANMQMICQGTKTRNEVVQETVREYEDAFRQANRQIYKFSESYTRNLSSAAA